MKSLLDLDFDGKFLVINVASHRKLYATGQAEKMESICDGVAQQDGEDTFEREDEAEAADSSESEEDGMEPPQKKRCLRKSLSAELESQLDKDLSQP